MTSEDSGDRPERTYTIECDGGFLVVLVTKALEQESWRIAKMHNVPSLEYVSEESAAKRLPLASENLKDQIER